MDQSLHLVAGLGNTGQSVARYLKRCNLPFIAFDTRNVVEGLSAFKVEFPDVEVFLQELPAAVYPTLKAIIASPGLPLDEPVIQQAMQFNIPIYGDIECLAREINVPVIAITGTNGKSTVTTLVGEMAKTAGMSVAVAGNIGTPVLDLLGDKQHYDLWVLELSSFQLELTQSLKPIAATILNITPDHLDRHHTFIAYSAAKQRIYHNASLVLYNRDDQLTYPINKSSAQQCFTSYGLGASEHGHWGILTRDGIDYLAHGETCLLPVESLRIKGTHNWQNALAACALASAAGIAQNHIISVLESFSGLPHRCQWVRTLNEVQWINDSKGTNIGATQSAIKGIGDSMRGKIVLIAGGVGKGADFSTLRQFIAEYVRSVVLIGSDADRIERAWSDLLPVMRASSMKSAITIAQSQAMSGDIVLLSPACASLDMFRDYNHRGDVFTNLVGQL